MIKKIIALVCLLTPYLFAEGNSVFSIADKFIKASHSFQGSSLPYRIFTPEIIDPAKKYPLVLALHGMGERGTDNNLQLTANKMATCWAETAIQDKNPCFVIAPQCPVTSGWADSPVKDVLLNLVETALTKYNIDKDRVYITGLSMGGNGTWNCISLRPDLFAAAVPIAGWGNNTKGPVLKNIPIWAYHGHSDNVVSVDNSRFMVEAIANQGIEAIYTNCYYVDTRSMPIEKLNNEIKARSSLIYSELLGYYHDVWGYAYSYQPMFDWVFSKRKFVQGAIKLSSFVSDTLVHGSIPIKWSSISPGDSVEIWYKSERQDYWKLLKKDIAGKKEFLWNTDAENECIYGKLRICLVDLQSSVYSKTESAWITIDKPTNGKPYVKLKTPDFIKANNIMSKRIDVNYIANDVESDRITVVFNYSADGGKTYSKIDSASVTADNELKTRTIIFGKLLNTNNGILKLVVYDEQREFSSDSTIPFTNQLGLDFTDVQVSAMNKYYKVLSCYPNPADQNSSIFLDLPTACEINVSVYNATGRLVFQNRIASLDGGHREIKIQTSHFPAGIYNCAVSFKPKNSPQAIQSSLKLIVRH